MKTFFVLVFTMSVFSICAQQPRSVENVQLERDRTFVKLTELRMKYIKEDQTLKKMHEQILQMHREMAMALDARRDIRELNEKLIQLDRELRELNKSRKKGK